ncbi:MAG: hypothetical protein Q8O51_02935 [bacterium]|nr:hypothetical protein [bacterium]
MQSNDSELSKGWKIVGYGVAGVFIILGVITAVSVVAKLWVAPHFVQAPVTPTQRIVLNQAYVWTSLPSVDSFVRAVLEGDDSDAYPGCISNGIFLTKRNGAIRFTTLTVQRCDECVMAVNLQQIDIKPDGTRDTTIYVQQSPAAFLGLWPWEKVDTTLTAMEGGVIP